MRVALLSPKWSRKANDYPPLGLAYLAAVLERDGHEVSVFDLGLEPQTPIQTEIDRICASDPQVVGITSMTSVYQSALDTAALLKARLGRPIVVGGPHATVFPERVLLEAPVIDYVVRGEGEETFAELVDALESGQYDVRGILGVTHRQHGSIVSNPDRPLIRDLDALPFPARHLVQMDRYGLRTPDGRPMVTILSSRGCPYNCAYCFKGIVGRTYRQRSPANIVAEIRQVIDTYGWRDFYFIDDLFTIDSRRLETLTDRFIGEGLEIRWQCLGRVDRVNAELLRKMYTAGCRQIHYGIESGNQQILERIGKGIDLDQVRKAVGWAQDAGIHAKGYFMLGLPGDTPSTMQETIDFAVELGLDEAMFSLTTPFPGTRLWDELVAKKPETEFGQDFARAYYYGDPDEDIAPFMNVSEVPDNELGGWLHKAQAALADGRSWRVYTKAFGASLGSLLWRVSRFTPVRWVARQLLAMGLFRQFAAMRKGNAKSWS
jgi:anaerobic magnesium-protoporphyrin IX monomethyl ester cyclase